MSIPDRYRPLAEKYKAEALAGLVRLERLRGAAFSDEAKKDLWEKGLWRLALMRAGEALPVPERITIALISTLPMSELTPLLCDYLCVFLDESGCYKLNGPYEKTVLGLPRGLRAVHNLTALDGEVQNGGFYQFFTNSSGKLARETLDDLRMIGATAHFDLLLRAIALPTAAAGG